MAQRTITEHTSDLSGTKTKSDSPTVQFGIDGEMYEIDLTDAEQRKLRGLCAIYLAQGRQIRTRRTGKRTAGKRTAGKRAAGTSAASDAAQVRTWARENGYEVPSGVASRQASARPIPPVEPVSIDLRAGRTTRERFSASTS